MSEVTNDDILSVLRAQAWERAKGELQSILVSYYQTSKEPTKFASMEFEINNFVKRVEDNAYHE